MNRLFLSLVFFLGANFCFCQNEYRKSDFFEIGFYQSTFTDSDFLRNPVFEEISGDPLIDPIGVESLSDGREFGLNIKFGRQVFRKFRLVSQLGYSRRDEKIGCWCHFCDKFQIEDALKIHSLEFGIGGRYALLQKSDINFSIESLAQYSISLNRDNIRYFNVSLSPVLGFDVSKSVQVNLKMIFEKSFYRYDKNDLPIEIAILKKI